MKRLIGSLFIIFFSYTASANCIDQIVNYRASQKGDLKTAVCFHKNKLYSESLPLLVKLAEKDRDALEYLLDNLPSGYESVVENFLLKIEPKDLNRKTRGEFIYWRTMGLNRRGKYSSVLKISKKFPKGHSKYHQVQYFRGVAYLNLGNKKMAESLFLTAKKGVKKITPKSQQDMLFMDVISSSLGKLYLTQKDYKKAAKHYKDINPQSPIWYQNLMELGWNQLISKNYSEALGNMYFVEKNTSTAAWKPDTYIIRSIGFLNLCHFSDANSSLKVVETYYKTLHEESLKAAKKAPDYYDLLKKSLEYKLASYVDGVPVPLIRYAAVDIDFIQVQESINNLIDEVESQKNLENKIVKRMNQHQSTRMEDIEKIASLKEEIYRLKHKKVSGKKLAKIRKKLAKVQAEYDGLKSSISTLRSGVEWQVKKLAAKVNSLERLKSKQEAKASRVLKNKVITALNSLKEKLNQAELVRFEIFSRSGNNIRYRLAGGKVSNKQQGDIFKVFGSKELKWAYNGEVWKDEYGSMDSSIKDQCDTLSKQARN